MKKYALTDDTTGEIVNVINADLSLPVKQRYKPDEGFSLHDLEEADIGDSVVDNVLVKKPAPTAPEPTQAEITQKEINTIEAEITPRRIREAILGTDNGWLAAKEAEIAAKRIG